MNNGDLNVHYINSVVLALLLGLFVLWRYRQAVVDGMAIGDPTRLSLPPIAEATLSQALPGSLPAHEAAMRRRIAAAYLLTTCLCGLLLAIGYFQAADWAWSPTMLLAYTLCYAMAAMPMIAVTLALSPLRIVALFLSMLVGFLALTLLSAALERLAGGRPISWQHLQLIPMFLDLAWNQLWMVGIFWLLSWPVRLRGVVPITFAALLLFGFGPLLGARLSAALAATEFGTPWVMRLGLNGVFLLIALPVGWLAWLRLRRLAADYEAKRFSDSQLLARMWWLMLVVTIGFDILIGRERPALALALMFGVVALFAPVNRLLLGWLGVPARAAAWPGRTLLLLRVFGYTARTERLFDRVAARWRLLGPVTMIAAPDVTARTMDAGDYLRWLTGRVDELFVTSQASLDARLATLDLAPDPDGRFRLNEFCCRDSSWQATVIELMARADAVIMDVRGITAERRGCEFELQQLALRLHLQRLVLVIDRTTDQAVLRSAFGSQLDRVRMVEVAHSWQADRAYAALLEAAG